MSSSMRWCPVSSESLSLLSPIVCLNSVVGHGDISDDMLQNIDKLIGAKLETEDPDRPDAGSAVGSTGARSSGGKDDMAFQRLRLG